MSQMTPERRNPIRVAIVETAQQAREALEFTLSQAAGLACVAALQTAVEAIENLPKLRPQVVLMDIHPDGQPADLQGLCDLRAVLPKAEILVRTADHDPATVFRCLMAGATGYLSKSISSDRLAAAIAEATEGGSPISPDIARLVTAFFQGLAVANSEWKKLTQREREVLELLTLGLLKKDIADRLHITQNTVCSRCRRIYEKLQVNSREQAVAKAIPLDALHLVARL